MWQWTTASLSLVVAAQDKGRPPQDDAPYNSRCAGCGINASRTRILLDRLIVRKRKYYAQEEWVPSGSLCHVARRQPASQQRRRRQSNTHDYLRPVYPTAETTNRDSRTVSVIGKLCGFQSGNGKAHQHLCQRAHPNKRSELSSRDRHGRPGRAS